MNLNGLGESSFLTSKDRPPVWVAKGDNPYKNTQLALHELNFSSVYGKKVLLKPNAGRVARPGQGITTDPRVVAAVMDTFMAAGATVAVGESPIVGVETHEAFEACGIRAVAQKRGCAMIDLNQRPFITVDIPDGIAIQRLKVCPEVLEYDIIVSIPVMKTHMHTGVSLSLKNMKGCLWRRSKVLLHMLPPIDGCDDKPIDIAIADMLGILRPHLSVIDGTIGMEGLGPSAGQPISVDAVIVSADAFAADAVACGVMGMAPQKVPHIRIGAGRNYGVIDFQKMHITPDNWMDWAVSFKKPPANLSIEFPNITVHDSLSCSACQSTLLLFLRHYRKILFDYFPAPVRIAIGRGHQQIKEGTLCIGNCTAALRKDGIFIPGCPPVSSQIIQAISGKRSVDVVDGRGRGLEEE